MSTKHSKQDRTSRKTGEKASRVGNGYERLDVAGTKKVFQKLNGDLDKVAADVIYTLEQAVPYLEKMQALLSQRGADRKKVLRKAGLPGWTPWLGAYATKLGRTIRTVQARIKHFREPKGVKSGGSAGKAKVNGIRNALRLDARQQTSLVKAQMAANDLAAALRSGADWQVPLAEYEKIAVTPSKLDQFVNALNPEPDWKLVLTNFSRTVEQCGDLPAAAADALLKVRRLLGVSTEPHQSQSAGVGSEYTSTPEVTKSPEQAGDPRTNREPEFPAEYSPALSAPEDGAPPVTCQEVDESGAGSSQVAESTEGCEQLTQADPVEKSLRRKLQKAKAAKDYRSREKAKRAARLPEPGRPQTESDGPPAPDTRRLPSSGNCEEARPLMRAPEAISVGLGL